MTKGKIRRLMDRGYGFILTEDGEDLFFHAKDLEGAEFNNLNEGQEVELVKSQGRDGRPAAVNVRLTEAQPGDEAGEETGAEAEDEGGDEAGAEAEDEGEGGDEAESRGAES